MLGSRHRTHTPGAGPRAFGLVVPLVAVLVASATAPLPDEVAEPAELVQLEADLQARGCEPLDPASCLLPFPSDHFTRPVSPNQIGGTARGGTGRRVDLHPLAMPANVAGKPVDPTEWNRNDGFSPGQMLLTYVPDLAVVRDEHGEPTGPVVGAPSIDDLGRSLAEDAAVVVIDAATGERHPVWAETDLNAGFVFPPGGQEKPDQTQPALMIRPATSFREGHRYVVALRNLTGSDGGRLAAPPFFAACRDGHEIAFPGLAERCAALTDDVFGVLSGHGIGIDENLYLAWDFTVASTDNTVGRLKHMRDDAFANVLGQQEDAEGGITDLGRAPDFEVTEVREGTEGRAGGKRFEEIHGTLEVPSYVVPMDPSPLEGSAAMHELLDLMRASGRSDLADAADLLSSVSAPPNRLHYDPTDDVHPDDPAMQPFGDGLPDRSGTMTVPWMCRLYEDATAERPARAGVYGHGLVDRRRAITYDAVPELSTFDEDHNYMFCAVDWFGFATGDLANILSVTVDLSLFPVVPDATQQGMLNFLFLARLLKHEEGLLAHEAFRAPDGPRFDNGTVFYHGISQGGILGGAVVAMSKDITRGVLGVPGMGYSLLLRRSTGWSGPRIDDDIPFSFSTLFYLAYPDDLDRSLLLSLIQMLWDRGENNGYAAHIADNRALGGADNQVMLRPAFADHQVTHWSASSMARTIAASGRDLLADVYPRSCETGVEFCFETRQAFSEHRDPDAELLYGLPVSDAEAFPAERERVPYDDPADGNPSVLSGLIMWDEGRTAIPPVGNIPPNWKDGHDPHGFPRSAPGSLCQQSHFLYAAGGLIDVREVIAGAPCPPLPPLGEDHPGRGRPPGLPPGPPDGVPPGPPDDRPGRR